MNRMEWLVDTFREDMVLHRLDRFETWQRNPLDARPHWRWPTKGRRDVLLQQARITQDQYDAMPKWGDRWMTKSAPITSG